MYIRLGEKVLLIDDASLPYIMRPMEDGRYRLMGECYCDGIMDGEVVGQQPKEDQQDTTLV